MMSPTCARNVELVFAVWVVVLFGRGGGLGSECSQVEWQLLK